MNSTRIYPFHSTSTTIIAFHRPQCFLRQNGMLFHLLPAANQKQPQPQRNESTLGAKQFSHQANFPNLRRLFIEARSDDEEREVSRNAVRSLSPTYQLAGPSLPLS